MSFFTWQRTGVLASVIVAVMVGAWWWQRQLTARTTLAKPEAPAQPTSINALGRIEPADGVLSITAATGLEGGRIQRLFVQEGETVAAGQPLFTLDSAPQLQRALREAEANVRTGVARLGQAQAGAKASELQGQSAVVSRIQAELRQAEVLLARAETLLQTGDMAKRDVEARRTQVEVLLQELARAREQRVALGEIRSTDIAVIQAEIAASQAATERVRNDLVNATARAPIAGIILRIYNHPGEVASNKVLEIADTRNMQVATEVYESDIRRVRLGQPAVASLTALHETLHGKVTRIGQQLVRRETVNLDPVAETESRVVRVIVSLDGPSALRAASLIHMQAEVRIGL